LGFGRFFQNIQASLSVFKAIKTPQEVLTLEFQFSNQVPFTNRKNHPAGFTVLSKNETFIPGSLLDVTVLSLSSCKINCAGIAKEAFIKFIFIFLNR
jgi:hypothetical protein